MLESLRSALARLRATFSADRIASEFDDELKEHLDMLTEEFLRQGMPAADARATLLAIAASSGPVRPSVALMKAKRLPAAYICCHEEADTPLEPW